MVTLVISATRQTGDLLRRCYIRCLRTMAKIQKCNNSKGELRNVVGDDRSRSSSQHQVISETDRNRQRTFTNESRNTYNAYRPTIRNLHVANTPHFYDSTEAETDSESSIKIKRNIKQSKRLPGWIWKTVTTVLGIDHSKRWLATILYVITLIAALAFTFLGVLFVVYDVASKNSETTVHIGFMSLLIGFGWLCLGIYSFRLAGRLFGDEDFAASIRSHSRTLFKISSAILLIISGCLFTGLNLYTAFDTYAADHCHVVGLHHLVCNSMYISRAVFSVLATVWNLMVGCMLLSVCRTHTIGIRRFVRDLERDGKKYDDYWKKRLRNSKDGEYHRETSSILDNRGWFVLQDSDLNFEEEVQGCEPEQQDLPANQTARQGSKIELQPSEDAVLMRDGSETPPRGPGLDLTANNEENIRNSLEDTTSIDEHQDEPPIMTEDEILLCYWKISSRMRFTSQCLQRWLASWIAFVGLWVGDYVIYWLSHSPDLVDILEFVAPMLLILVLCSAYAEANGEGQLMIRCICPTKDRYGLLNFLHRQPLQMQVFSLSVSYNAMLTVILAFTVAFSSRLILDEVVKP
ncbi:uncharacterized protein LOC123540328 isoform X2 [Mercenaria mercenaria]|uniref:uncharacterized protein LOC123540328 isoform X2 n=1 Tax=Mercenaria mercenaria TaxID=6596 RepID=UPI00234F8F8E|nr:uncharacterized protein LOC123540328 isoform X2 [Mercenaria mercenaria]